VAMQVSDKQSGLKQSAGPQPDRQQPGRQQPAGPRARHDDSAQRSPAIATVTVQSGRPSSRIAISAEAQADVEQAYLTSQRLRFRTEIVRLTGGAMRDMLRQRSAVIAGDPGTANQLADQLAFMMSYVYAWQWLQVNVHTDYQARVLDSFMRGKQGFLMQMLLASDSTDDFIARYVDHWLQYQGAPQLQQQQVLQLLQRYGDRASLLEQIGSVWQSLGVLEQSFAEGYKQLAREEKERYAGMLDDNDRERLALIDRMVDARSDGGPDVELPRSFAKMGIIPAMGCPQTCRHCMFIFRPLMKNTDDPDALYQIVNSLTNSVLFTGGDLTKQLQHFYDAIATMSNVTTFAILLNGDFADSRRVTRDIMGKMAAAIRQRPISWPKAKVMLQISFDEFHQEVVVNKQGELNERIPVTKIANIVETAPKYADEIQLCLLHKQVQYNFSMELFEKGVFARLARELGRRGHQVQVLSSAPSSRLKRNPGAPRSASQQPAQLIRDATFILTEYPDAHMLLTSTTIDAYGRANMMELHEAVNERDLLRQMLDGNGTAGETFDKDIMLWFNGWVTLFSAVHVCLGNFIEEGMDVIRRRQAYDPLSDALNRFDLKLLDYYRECRGDLDDIIERSTSPHHLFHTITEHSDVRLHMTKRLLGA